MSPRPARSGPDGWLAAAWIVGCVLLLTIARGAILRFETIDPDDQLRLQQVRDWLGGQGWFDVTQFRVNPPGGTAMHWSRLVDVPIALVLRIARLFAGGPAAETAALAIVPLLTFGCALWLVALLARRLFAGAWPVRIAALLLAIDAGVLLQMRPMRIDHHGWQIVCSLGIVVGLVGRTGLRAAVLAGLAAALLLNISIEGLPFTVLAGGLVALRGVQAADGRRWQLTGYLGGLAAGSVAAFVAVHGGLTPITFCDAVSPVHLAVFGVAAIGAALTASCTHATAGRLAGLAATAAACAALYALAAPMCLAGPFAQLDPLVRDTWYLRVREGLPIWAQDRATVMLMIGYPLIGLAGAVVAARADGARRTAWTDYALLLAGAIAIALLVERASGIANVLAVPGGVALMVAALGRIAAWRSPLVRPPASACAVLLLLPATPALIGTLAFAAPPARVNAAARGDATCDTPARLARIGRLPSARILAPIDIAASLVLHTRHSVLATGHHRNRTGMRDAIRFFTGDPDQARRIVATHGIGYVMLCPSWTEIAIYRGVAPDGMAARLSTGRAPGWLRPMPDGDGPLLWRVVR